MGVRGHLFVGLFVCLSWSLQTPLDFFCSSLSIVSSSVGA
jgi:hypothetical protein